MALGIHTSLHNTAQCTYKRTFTVLFLMYLTHSSTTIHITNIFEIQNTEIIDSGMGNVRIRVLESYIKPILKYKSESWAMQLLSKQKKKKKKRRLVASGI